MDLGSNTSTTISSVVPSTAATAANDERLRLRYRQLVNGLSAGDTDTLRKLVLLEGLPSDANALQSAYFGRCSLRGLIWKALLGVGRIDVDEYTRLVRQGPSVDDSRVREDARRTFAKSDDFTTRVPTDKLIRLLNAYVVYRGNRRGVYAQSMSLLAAPFLYVMPEPDAFHCFRAFLDHKVGSYVQKYAGARRACQLLDKCIMSCLPDLHESLTRHGLYAEVYAFPVMSSLGMCVRPVFDTVRLWDVLLAFGIHMHIVFTLARLALCSDHIVHQARKSGAAPLSTRELEQGLGLKAEAVLAKGVTMSAQLDSDLYSELVAHAAAAAKSRADTSFDRLQSPPVERQGRIARLEDVSIEDAPRTDDNDDQFQSSQDKVSSRADRRGIRTSYDRVQKQNFRLKEFMER